MCSKRSLGLLGAERQGAGSGGGGGGGSVGAPSQLPAHWMGWLGVGWKRRIFWRLKLPEARSRWPGLWPEQPVNEKALWSSEGSGDREASVPSALAEMPILPRPAAGRGWRRAGQRWLILWDRVAPPAGSVRIQCLAERPAPRSKPLWLSREPTS